MIPFTAIIIKIGLGRRLATDGQDNTSLVPNVYYPEQIARFIINHVSALLAQNREPSFENSLDKRKDNSADRWIIRSHELFVILTYSVTDIELENLQQILLAFTREGEIMNNIRRWSDVNVEIGRSKQEFEGNLKELINDIEDPENGYLLEGKCKRCELWDK